MKGEGSIPARGRGLVVGATQGTGSHIVQRLLRDGHEVRVLARNEAKARDRFRGTVEVVEGDVTKPGTLPPAMSGQDHVILTVGVIQRRASEWLVKPTVYDGVPNVLAAARDAGLGSRFSTGARSGPRGGRSSRSF